jgi:hypothetical protein
MTSFANPPSGMATTIKLVDLNWRSVDPTNPSGPRMAALCAPGAQPEVSWSVSDSARIGVDR